MTGSKPQFESFDAIDGEILQILTEDPRTPYSEITEQLANAGYEMSTEGVRYRVGKILDTTTIFFLLDPREMTWEIVRITVIAANEPGAKQEAFELLNEMSFWHVSKGIGTADVFAVGSMPSNRDIDDAVTTIREHECIDRVEYLIVTDRNRDMHSYLNLNYLDISEE
jgi:DNA-binding Lrp family transcriptional regulator